VDGSQASSTPEAVLLTTRRLLGAVGGVLSPAANETVSLVLNDWLPDGSSARTWNVWLLPGIIPIARFKRTSSCVAALVRNGVGLSSKKTAYLIVNTKFWEMEPIFPKEPVTVFRTVHVGDVVKAWEADSPDPDDFIGSDKVGRGRGTLIFEGDDARYLASYQPGAC
jgi:hypothetical protein